MFTLRTEEQYQQQALSRLPTQFRGKPRLEALLLAMAGQHQDAEAGAFTLFSKRLLATATGAALTQLGLVVGQERGGLDDTSYRLRIAARLLLNRSSGTVPEILFIFSLLTPLDLELLEYYPASFELRVSGGELQLPADFAAILSEARAGGVGARLLFQLEGDADTFSFAGEDGTGFPASHPGHISEAELVVNGFNPVAPSLLQDPPPEATGPYLVRVEITNVNGGADLIDFEYTLNDGETPRMGTAFPWSTSPPVTLFTEAAIPSGLVIVFGPSEPYVDGDTWTWTVGALAGGSLTGILQA